MSLDDWLESEDLDGFEFQARRWIPGDNEPTDLVHVLGREILKNYAEREWLTRRLESMGYERLAKHIEETVLPPEGNTRTGDFGEIISTFMLRRHEGFFVPVLRLRYKDSPSGTQRLMDVVAFKFRKAPEETTIAVAEVKTRTTSSPSAGEEAAQQLSGAIADLPLSLSFMDRRLTAEGKHSLADKVLALLDPDATYQLARYVFVVTDPEVVHEETVSRIDGLALPTKPMTELVLLRELNALIKDGYEAAKSPT